MINIKEVEKSRTCGTFGRGMRNAYTVLVSKSDGRTTPARPTLN